MSRTRHERPRRRLPGDTTCGKKPGETRRWYKRNVWSLVPPPRDRRRVDPPEPVARDPRARDAALKYRERREVEARAFTHDLGDWREWWDAYVEWDQDDHYYDDLHDSWSYYDEGDEDPDECAAWLDGFDLQREYDRDHYAYLNELEQQQAEEEAWMWRSVEDPEDHKAPPAPDLVGERELERRRAGDRHYRHARR